MNSMPFGKQMLTVAGAVELTAHLMSNNARVQYESQARGRLLHQALACTFTKTLLARTLNSCPDTGVYAHHAINSMPSPSWLMWSCQIHQVVSALGSKPSYERTP
jgi:hypothetical protein